METNHVCCFTGYRPNKFPFPFKKESLEYVSFENKLVNIVFSLSGEGVDIFYSGAAIGFDIVAAETVLLLKKHFQNVKLICVVPFRSQAEKWPIEWKKRYENILREADEVVLISEEYRRDCYRQRNEYMVDNSSKVVTFYDGRSGGTCNTLVYAKKKGLSIINIAEESSCEHDCEESIQYMFGENLFRS